MGLPTKLVFSYGSHSVYSFWRFPSPFLEPSWMGAPKWGASSRPADEGRVEEEGNSLVPGAAVTILACFPSVPCRL